MKFVRLLFVFTLVVAAGLAAMLALRGPRLHPASSEAVERTPERIARGRYLVENVSDCYGCHAGRIAESYGLPVKPGSEGEGGFKFDENFGVPGVVCAQNITPDRRTGLGEWTDGEVIRAIREGVDRHGKALFPMMPYLSYRQMSDEDVRSVVAFLRTLPSIEHEVPGQRLRFPVNLLVKSSPQPVEGPVVTPNRNENLAYGKYLVTIAGCRECHTAHDARGQLMPGGEFAGGWEMRGPWGRVVSANITPDPGVFMGQATKEQFIGRMKAFATFDAGTAPLAPRGRNTVMPWLAYSRMTEADLGAIYDYLKTLPPIKKQIVVFPDAPDAPLPPGAPAPVGSTGT